MKPNSVSRSPILCDYSSYFDKIGSIFALCGLVPYLLVYLQFYTYEKPVFSRLMRLLHFTASPCNVDCCNFLYHHVRVYTCRWRCDQREFENISVI